MSPRKDPKAWREYQKTAYERQRHSIHTTTPPWIIPPLRYCGPLTLALIEAAGRNRLLVVKSSDAKRIGLSHYSRGVIHTAENTDTGKRMLIRWCEEQDGTVSTGDIDD